MAESGEHERLTVVWVASAVRRRLFIASVGLVLLLVGCARYPGRTEVEQRTGLKLPKSSRLASAMIDSGPYPAFRAKVMMDPASVRPFIASLPAGSKVSRTENYVGECTDAPSWWDVGAPVRFVAFSARDAGYGPVVGVVKLDNRQHPVLYLYSSR